MSDRNAGDTFSPKEIGEGLYDLDQWNEAYRDNYWATYIKDAAEERGRKIHVTTMLFAPDNSVRRVMTFGIYIHSPRCPRTTRMPLGW
ncbi:MAG: hypothetical protein ACLFQA_07365 [Bacteroidales bacterium]